MGLWKFLRKKNHPEATDSSARPVRDDVVRAYDQALSALGGKVRHAAHPDRARSFAEGGPPLFSVGMVDVAAETPYTLLLTYGFSHTLSPEPLRDGFTHEYSIALPQTGDPSVWADSLLSHLTQYVLNSGRELSVGDVMDCYAPISNMGADEMGSLQSAPGSVATPLSGIVTERDPVLPEIPTPYGPVEVRRFLGIHQEELADAENRSSTEFLADYRKSDALLITDLKRPSVVPPPGGED
ncbi:MAG: suppressor of fused domain protein [Myxococcota bacterium]